MINVLKLCVFTWLMLVFSLSYGATCTAQASFSVSPSNIVVQRDAPVGTKLLEANSPEKIAWNCSGSASDQNVGLKTYGRYVSSIDGKISMRRISPVSGTHSALKWGDAEVFSLWGITRRVAENS